MDFAPSSLANPATILASALSGVSIVASTISGSTIAGSTLSGTTIVASTLSGATFIGGTLSGSSLVGVTVNSGSTISVYALPARQFVHVTKTSGQSINNNSFTKVTYQTEVYDDSNVYSSNRMTPTVAGKYLVVASVSYDDSVASDFLTSSIYKNGSQVAADSNECVASNTNSALSSAYVNINGSTDYLEHFTRQVNAATTDRTLSSSTDRTYFMAMWMST